MACPVAQAVVPAVFPQQINAVRLPGHNVKGVASSAGLPARAVRDDVMFSLPVREHLYTPDGPEYNR